MRAGALRHRVEIQSASTTNDAGDVERTWSTDETTNAHVEHLSGEERYEAGKQTGAVEARFKMRYRDITTDQRLKWNGNTYDILGAYDPNGLGREVIVEAQRL